MLCVRAGRLCFGGWSLLLCGGRRLGLEHVERDDPADGDDVEDEDDDERVGELHVRLGLALVVINFLFAGRRAGVDRAEDSARHAARDRLAAGFHGRFDHVSLLVRDLKRFPRSP